MDKKRPTKKAKPRTDGLNAEQVKYIRTGGLIVIGIFVVCLVVFMAKGMFSSNSDDIPIGIDTATSNTAKDAPVPAKADSKADSQAKKDESATDSKADDSSEADESSEADSEETAIVNQYAYLHKEPDKDAENIVCMSPNIEVTVLEKLDNGYWKVTFMNIDGQKTGYVWSEYLQPSVTP